MFNASLLPRTGPFALLGLLVVTACDGPPDETSSRSPTAPEFSRGAVVDAEHPVVDFATLDIQGTSKLVRTADGVSYRVSTSNLEPGHAYTLWFVVFNDPSGCLTRNACIGDDVVNPEAEPDMAYAAGHVAGTSGHDTFAGSKRVGPLTTSVNEPVLPSSLANGLTQPLTAEIHLVVHHHGAKLPEYMPDMIQSIDGGCTDAGVPEAGAPSPWNEYDGPPLGGYGRRGPNSCASVQFAVHRP